MKRVEDVLNVRVRRIIERKSQREVAEDIGVSRQYIHRLEIGVAKPSEERREQISEYYGKPADYLFSVAE